MPKVVTQRCLKQDLNPRPTDRKPKCFTVAPPLHYLSVILIEISNKQYTHHSITVFISAIIVTDIITSKCQHYLHITATSHQRQYRPLLDSQTGSYTLPRDDDNITGQTVRKDERWGPSTSLTKWGKCGAIPSLSSDARLCSLPHIVNLRSNHIF